MKKKLKCEKPIVNIYNDIYFKIMEEFQKIRELENSINSEYTNLNFTKNKNDIAAFSLLLIKHCKFYHDPMVIHIKEFFQKLNLVEKPNLDLFFMKTDFSELSKIPIGYIKTTVNENKAIYYSIIIEVDNTKYETKNQAQETRIIFKEITGITFRNYDYS